MVTVDEAHLLTGEQREEAAPRSFVRKNRIVRLGDGASVMSYTARASDWPAFVASQALGCCEHESSSRAPGVALPVLSDSSRRRPRFGRSDRCCS